MKILSAKFAMTFGIVLVAVFVLLGGSIGFGQEMDPQTNVSGKIPLRILYVGMTGTERSKDFVGFLGKNFSEVKFAEVGSFKESQAKGRDVVILDKDGIEWGGRGDTPALSTLSFSEEYSVPTVSLGIPGAFLTSAMNLKTGYM